VNRPDLPAAGAVDRGTAHESAVLHVTGRARYIDDVPPRPGEVHVAAAGATIAAGRIVRMDLEAVRAAPGVLDVFTHADIPGNPDVGAVFEGDPLLARDEVQFLGQPLFAVAATSFRAARRALALADIEYAPVEPILDPVLAHERGHHVLPPRDFLLGDADAALAGADRVQEVEVAVAGQEHFYLEGQIALAWPTEEGIHVLSSSQHPGDVQRLVARLLGVPDSTVVAETRRMGGGFGGKESQAAPLACLAALVAAKLDRPARYRMARGEDFAQTGKRHGFVHRGRYAHDENGALLGVAAELIGDCGCSADLSEGVVDRALFHADNAYFLRNARLTGVPSRTHKVSSTAFRGFGGPQGALLAETVMDDIAFRTGRDPLDVRLANLYGVHGTETPYGQHVDDDLGQRLITSLEARSDYRARRAAITEANAAGGGTLRGIALTPVKFGISFTTTHLNQAGALVHLYTDGSVRIAHGGTEMGQGLYTKVRGVVADFFGLPPEAVQCSATRTDKVANATPTAASAGADLNGMAALDACARIRAGLEAFATERWGTAPEALAFVDGRVRVGEEDLSFADFLKAAFLARIPLWSSGFYATPDIHFDKTTRKGHPFHYYAWGAAVSEVAVDTGTGEYRLERVDILHDVGRSLNRAIDVGQVEGGFVQGLGWLTTEDLQWDASGRLASAGPATYKIPTAADVPEHFRVELFDEPNRVGALLRSKAVGEPPLVLAISVYAALRAAVAAAGPAHHVPRLDLPATPERVFFALERARAERAS
jgi:xanthine dehydrogenase large subunit